MKIGIFLSVALVALFIMLLLLNVGPSATPPTSDTSGPMLKRFTVDAGDHPLWTPANPDGSADEAYRKAWAYFDDNTSTLAANMIQDGPAEAWAAMFISAAKVGQVSDGFLDKDSPMLPAARGPYNDALAAAPRVVLGRAQTLFEEGKKEQAYEMARAIWALGVRGFNHNTRARERYVSFFCMMMAQNAFHDWLAEDDPLRPNVKYWGDRIREMDPAWKRKTELLMLVSPNIGDMIRMAGEDQDPTFRMEATLKLGILQHAPKNKANLKLMHKTIAANKQDKNPQIAKAAEAAEAITVEQVQKMR